jgi:hypothetical protein
MKRLLHQVQYQGLGDQGVCTMVYKLQRVGIEYNLVGLCRAIAMSNYECQIGMMIHHN